MTTLASHIKKFTQQLQVYTAATLELFLHCVCTLVTQLSLTFCNPMDCSSPGSSVHGIPQARILEWIAIPFSRGSSLLRDQTQVSHIIGRFFTI